MSADRVLSLSLRPKQLADCVGQDDLVALLENQFNSGRIPHFYILHGPPGCGKTTLARIIALALQTPKDADDRLHPSPEMWAAYRRYEIREINAANQNGIDDIRALLETMRFQPMAPSKARVIILDEAHQLTAAAQNALLTEVEDVPGHVYYIFCTSQVSKILPALQRRAYVMAPKSLTDEDTGALLTKAAAAADFDEDIAPLTKALTENAVTSPGLVLQAAEKFFGGLPAEESVFQTDISNIDTMAVCRAVMSGSWKTVAPLLKAAGKSDIMPIKFSVAGYLKAVLLKSTGPKAMNVANAIRVLSDDSGNDSVPVFLANICLACSYLA
jgi:DNA polymerase III delta prime subunit